MTQIVSAKEEEVATTPAMFPNPEGEQTGHCKRRDLHAHRKEGSIGQIGTAKVEPNRPVTTETLFEPYYHPEAASSDGRERKRIAVGKSAVLTFLEGQKGKREPPTKQPREVQEEKCSKAAKKKTKPKYVPGPIGALIDQAETVGLQLTIN